jgi:uncharacterized protein
VASFGRSSAFRRVLVGPGAGRLTLAWTRGVPCAARQAPLLGERPERYCLGLCSSGVDRRTLPLTLASQRFAGEMETQPLDRLRMQKGVFLLEMRGSPGWRHLYSFEPYSWGPYSSALARELQNLTAEDLLDVDTGGARHDRYRTSASGESWLESQVSLLSSLELDFIKSVREFVTTRRFSSLLRDVYAAYPEFAVRSRFTG